ncbi:MAG: heavy metal translocating P-type ATPase [Firmicutes bacterium]|nr:heavy metal translocating P-type ATPase [Bacillota bacterium]
MLIFVLIPFDRLLPKKIAPYVRFGVFLIPYLIVGYDILLKAVKGIINKQVFDECFLMAVATIGAILLGEYVEGVAVMLFYQIGELFQSVAVGKSRRSISDLMDIRPDYANIEEDGQLVKVDPDEVEIGTVIVVQPGEKVPIDGVVTEGVSSLDTSALTGESLPRSVHPGSSVISGCINQSGLLHIETTCEFDESTASKILDLVENSGMKKSRSENFITKFARVYTPAVCYGALALALLPPLVRLLMGTTPAWSDWIFRALTFLVISCPCALVISIPLSFFAGIGGASRQGILVKGSSYLEMLSKTKTVVFDKTGTMTRGTFEVTDIDPSEDAALTWAAERSPKEIKAQLLEYAALAECHSSHPISRSLQEAYIKEISGSPDEISAASSKKGSAGGAEKLSSSPAEKDAAEGAEKVSPNPLDQNRVSAVEEISGHGVEATVDNLSVLVGNAKLLRLKQIDPPAESTSKASTVVYVAIDGKYAGTITISDVIKPTAPEAIAALSKMGITDTVMLTGDNRAVAEEVASLLHVSQVKSELLPQDKVLEVEKRLQQKKASDTLVFVGDGINDAPVLARADIGIAMGALGSDAAIEAADVVLMDDNPVKIASAIRLSRKCMRIVYENIYFAIGIKLLCLLLGALGIANMWLAIFADVGVMVLAVLNAIRALKA